MKESLTSNVGLEFHGVFVCFLRYGLDCMFQFCI